MYILEQMNIKLVYWWNFKQQFSSYKL